MELWRLKSIATNIVFPMIDADGDSISAMSDPDSEILSWSDGSIPCAFSNCTGEALSIADGIYFLPLTAGEMSWDHLYIQVKATGLIKTQHILINTQEAVLEKADGVSLASILTNISLWGTSNAIATASLIVGVQSAIINIGRVEASTTVGVASILAQINVFSASAMRDFTSIAINVTSIMRDVTSTIVKLDVFSPSMTVGIASIVSRINLWGTSAAIATTSLIIGVQSTIAKIDIMAPSITVGVASIVSRIDLWGTSLMVGITSTQANVAQASTMAALNNISAADVNAEVLDVLNVDTFAEPGQEAPAATSSLVKKIGYLFKNWRNRKTATSTAINIYADDAVTVDQKITHSDDGNQYDRGEITNGP